MRRSGAACGASGDRSRLGRGLGRPAALRFQADHKGHGEVRHAKHEAGYHVLACDCREHLIVDVPISSERFDGLPAFPLAREDGPRVGLDDVAATLGRWMAGCAGMCDLTNPGAACMSAVHEAVPLQLFAISPTG